MDTLIDPRLLPGGNNPPEPISPSIERADELVATANRWITERPEITDEETANKARDFVEQIRKSAEACETARVEEKAPHRAAAEAVDAKFKVPKASLDLALKAMKGLLTPWLEKLQRQAAAEAEAKRVEARRLEEAAREAARLAEEAAQTKGANPIVAQLKAEEAAEEATAAHKAASKAPPVARAAGNFATRSMGLRTTWHARLKTTIDGRPFTPKEADANATAILKFYAKNRVARDAMVAACLAIADKQAKVDKREDTAPAGVEFFSTSTAS